MVAVMNELYCHKNIVAYFANVLQNCWCSTTGIFCRNLRKWMAVESCFWIVQADDFQENILCGIILAYNRHSEQSVCNLTKGRSLQSVFTGEIFENGWLRTAASEVGWVVLVCKSLLWTVSFYFDQKKDSTTGISWRNYRKWMAVDGCFWTCQYSYL